MSEKLYKVTGKNGTPCNGGSGKYYLPTKRKDGTWKPGKWMPPVKGDLELCANGYHLCHQQDLLEWLNEEIYEAEYRGERIDGDDKIVVRQVRLLRCLENWNERTAREFACWCALQVEHLWDMPDIVKEYLETQNEDIRDAAWDAAKDAALDAAWAATRAAVWDAVWDAARAAALDAAWAATRAAVWDAVWDAARAAARAAARDAQQKRLIEMLQETND